MNNNTLNNDNQKSFDNITKENLSTYLNQYISDTIYILQLQINKSFTNNLNNINNKSLKVHNEDESINFNEEINIIKKINNSLEKELLCLNNPKINDISKIIKVLSQRNELLNNLMNLYFTKQKILENKELFRNNKMKTNYRNKNNNNININNSLDKKYIKINEQPKINSYLENSKKNNLYNYKKLPLTSNLYYNNNNINYDTSNEDFFYFKKITKNQKKPNKNNINKSYEITNKDMNNFTIINNENINYNGNNNNNNGDMSVNNYRGRNTNQRNKKKRVNSVVHTLNNDLLNTKYENNNKSKFNMKNIYQLNKLNLEKLNDISSNILSIKNYNKNE